MWGKYVPRATVHKCISFRFYGGPQLSHQIQIHYIKYKFTTSNTNSPHQIQIHHIKYKFTTSNTNSSHQIQIHHIKYKFTTSKTNSHHIKNKFPTSKSKTQIKWSAGNERKLSPVFTRPSPDRHFVLAHYGGPQLSRQNQKSRQNKMNSRQDNINSRENSINSRQNL